MKNLGILYAIWVVLTLKSNKLKVLKDMKNMWSNIYLRFILLTIAIVACYFLFSATSSAIISIFVAFFLSYLLNPLTTFMARFHLIPRNLSVVFSILFLLFIFILLAIALTGVILEAVTIPQSAAKALIAIDSWLRSGNAPHIISKQYLQASEVILENDLQLTNYSKQIFSFLENSLRTISSSVGSIFQSVINVFLLLFLTAYMLSDFDKIMQNILHIFPPRHQEKVFKIALIADKTMGGYIKAKLLEATVMATLTWIALLILKIPQAASIAVIVFMLNPIPYIGSFLGTILTTTLAFTVSPKLALITLIVMLSLEQIGSNFISPFLMSKNVDISPVLSISAVLIGGALLGFVGLIIAIPIAAFIAELYKNYYRTSYWYKKQ